MRGLLLLLNMPDSSLQDYKIGINNLINLDVDCLIPSHYGFTLSNGKKHIKMASQAINSSIDAIYDIGYIIIEIRTKNGN